jgi:DNA-binding XRE family transcriptional regulator
MEAQMKINGAIVRALRERKSWSQEHLANASGLSARTVQRVEMEGIGSAETRLALAGALGVPVADLIAEPHSSAGPVPMTRRMPLWGWLAWGVGIICSVGVVAYGYGQGAFPPNQIVANLLPTLAFFGICAGVWATRSSWRR